MNTTTNNSTNISQLNSFQFNDGLVGNETLNLDNEQFDMNGNFDNAGYITYSDELNNVEEPTYDDLFNTMKKELKKFEREAKQLERDYSNKKRYSIETLNQKIQTINTTYTKFNDRIAPNLVLLTSGEKERQLFLIFNDIFMDLQHLRNKIEAHIHLKQQQPLDVDLQPLNTVNVINLSSANGGSKTKHRKLRKSITKQSHKNRRKIQLLKGSIKIRK